MCFAVGPKILIPRKDQLLIQSVGVWINLSV